MDIADPPPPEAESDTPIAMFSAPGHRDTVWSDLTGSVAHSKIVRWVGGVAATHAIEKVSGGAEIRTRSFEMHFSWNSGVAEAEAESGERIWAYKSRPRYGLVLPPNANVEFKIKEKSRYRFLAIEFDPLFIMRSAELQHLATVDFFEAWEYEHPLAWHLAEALFAECEGEAQQGLLYVETAATLLALHAVRNLSNITRPTNFYSRGGLAPVVLRRICDYMVERLGSDLSLSELAGISGLSTGHFGFAFKQSTGISPHIWLRRQRIDRAKELIRHNMHLASVATTVGFANQSAFGVAFRKETGLTPTAWRRLHML